MKQDLTNTVLKILPLCNRSLDRRKTIVKLNEILSGLVERKGLDGFRQLKEEMLELITPSVNPDNFTDLEDALERIENNLKASLELV